MFMSLILPLILCFLPLIAGVLIFVLAFKSKISHIFISILLGLVAVFPISFIQFFIPDFTFLSSSPILKTLLQSLILYGLTEEILKTLLIWPIPKKDKSVFDFLLLAFTFGLSLGCFESVVYYLDHLQMANNRGATLLFGTIFARIFSSDIIHMTCSGLCGLFIFSIKEKQPRLSCLFSAIFLHSFYDFFAGFQNNLHWFSIFVILLSIVECRIKYSSFAPSDS